MQTQKELVSLHPAGGILNIDILSFQRLAYRIFEETGGSLYPVLEETGKSLVVKRVAQEKKKELTILGSTLKRTGAVSQMKSLISELKQYQIAPFELDAWAEETGEKKLLAAKLNAVRIGQGVIERDRAAEAAEGAFTLRKRAARHNFFFSAEDFIAYIGWVSRAKEEARRELIRIREDDAIPDKAYASMPYAHTLEDLAGLYAGDLACQSHGEGFLDFFISRLHPDGLYLLDEPEGALSFEKQYALALTIWEGAKDSQFILATHSPILTAIPGAEIIEIVDGVMKCRRYEELSHIQFLRLFLERPERMFR